MSDTPKTPHGDIVTSPESAGTENNFVFHARFSNIGSIKRLIYGFGATSVEAGATALLTPYVGAKLAVPLGGIVGNRAEEGLLLELSSFGGSTSLNFAETGNSESLGRVKQLGIVALGYDSDEGRQNLAGKERTSRHIGYTANTEGHQRRRSVVGSMLSAVQGALSRSSGILDLATYFVDGVPNIKGLRALDDAVQGSSYMGFSMPESVRVGMDGKLDEQFFVGELLRMIVISGDLTEIELIKLPAYLTRGKSESEIDQVKSRINDLILLVLQLNAVQSDFFKSLMDALGLK